jgi:hypothetical protein
MSRSIAQRVCQLLGPAGTLTGFVAQWLDLRGAAQTHGCRVSAVAGGIGDKLNIVLANIVRKPKP